MTSEVVRLICVVTGAITIWVLLCVLGYYASDVGALGAGVRRLRRRMCDPPAPSPSAAAFTSVSASRTARAGTSHQMHSYYGGCVLRSVRTFASHQATEVRSA